MAWIDLNKVDFGEKMLWLCAMRRAIFDYVLYKGSGRHRIQWQKANQFLFEPDLAVDEGLNFEQICSLFNYEPGYIRRLISKLNRTDLKKIETTKFRDDFLTTDTMRFFVDVLRWDTTGMSVPFFPPYNYAPSIRDQLRLRSVSRPQRQVSMPLPRAAWAVAL